MPCNDHQLQRRHKDCQKTLKRQQLQSGICLSRRNETERKQQQHTLQIIYNNQNKLGRLIAKLWFLLFSVLSRSHLRLEFRCILSSLICNCTVSNVLTRWSEGWLCADYGFLAYLLFFFSHLIPRAKTSVTDFSVNFSALYRNIGKLNKTYKVKKSRRKPQTLLVCGLKNDVTTKISLFTVERFLPHAGRGFGEWSFHYELCSGRIVSFECPFDVMQINHAYFSALNKHNVYSQLYLSAGQCRLIY